MCSVVKTYATDIIPHHVTVDYVRLSGLDYELRMGWQLLAEANGAKGFHLAQSRYQVEPLPINPACASPIAMHAHAHTNTNHAQDVSTQSKNSMQALFNSFLIHAPLS